MKSFADCIKGFVESGKLSKREAKKLIDENENRFQQLKNQLGDEKAAREAVSKFIDDDVLRLQKEKRNLIQTGLKNAEARKAIDEIAAVDGGNYGRAASIYFNRVAREVGVYNRNTLKMFDKVFADSGGNPKKIDPNTIKDGVTALLGGEAVTKTGRIFGDSLRQVLDTLFEDFKYYGGDIKYLANYFPVSHVAKKIKGANQDEWVAFVSKRLDRKKMLDGGQPMDDEALDLALRDIYQTIVNEGLPDAAAQGRKFTNRFARKKMFERRNDARFLHWDGPNAFLEYNEKFGRGNENLGESIQNYITNMSKDISLMKRLGPDPYSAKASIESHILKKGANKHRMGLLNKEFAVLSGLGGDYDGLAWSIVSGAGAFQRAIVLGSASISALTDVAFTAGTAVMRGLSVPSSIINYFKGIARTRSVKDVESALGYNYEILFGGQFQQNRMAAGFDLRGISGALGNSVHKMSGLNWVTKGAKNGSALESLQTIKRVLDKDWNGLSKELKQGFTFYGITPEEFNLLKTVEPIGPNKEASWFDPQMARRVSDNSPLYKAMEKKARKELKGSKSKLSGEDFEEAVYLKAKREVNDLVDKIETWVDDVGDTAINQPDITTRAIVTGGMPAGDPFRAALSLITELKTFPITVMHTHLMPSIRRISQNKNLSSLDQAIITGGISMLVANQVVLPLKDLLAGKTIEPNIKENGEINTKKIVKSMWQSGFAGIPGDFLLQVPEFYGQKYELLGPTGGKIVGGFAEYGRIFYSDKSYEEKMEKLGLKLRKSIYRNIPYQSLWYINLAQQRLVVDNLERLLDPDFDSKISRATKRLEKKRQEWWWAPGEDPDVEKLTDSVFGED